MMTTQQTPMTRKANQILACAYGHIWPLSDHARGYVLILNPETGAYLWAIDRRTLEQTRRDLTDR